MIYEMKKEQFDLSEDTMALVELEKNRQIEKEEKRRVNLEKKLIDIFLTLGIPAHLNGYKYLKESIKIVMKDPQCINAVTKKLYPTVARKFNTTSCRVERAIRNALDVSYSKGKIMHLNKIFGLEIVEVGERPTNSEFVALIADKLSLDTK